MKTDEILKRMDDQEFLDKIYQFSYHRCDTSHEAEELCSDILLSVLSAAYRQDSIENFYAFVWTIARRVYADFCEKRQRRRRSLSLESLELSLAAGENEIDQLIEDTAAAEHLKKIFTEIAFLSKIYREVMIMYYLEEKKIGEIAAELGIRDTTVKQRLFSARNIIRKEVETMSDRILSLKPVHLSFAGMGKPGGNNPAAKAERTFSQNLIYLCKDKPRSAKELSEELCVPMPYVEEELLIQCGGENGRYGALRQTEHGTYATNILVADYSEYDKANQIYEKYIPDISVRLKAAVEKYQEELLAFPYLAPPKDLATVLWTVIPRAIWGFEEDICTLLKSGYFADISEPDRPYSCVAVAYGKDDAAAKSQIPFYGCDTTCADAVGGYQHVFAENIYGSRLDKHFAYGHNLSQDAKLLMVLRAIDGLSVNSLTDDERELAAKCIECGYLCRQGDTLAPAILILRSEDAEPFWTLHNRLSESLQDITKELAAQLARFIKEHIPAHLSGEYRSYVRCIASERFLPGLIEECIRTGLLDTPESRLSNRGVLMVVRK